MRIERKMEQAIAKATIKALIDADYFVTVNDGEEETVKRSRDADAIFAAMFTTDEDYLIATKKNPMQGRAWVRFIYGNSGWDVINDYTTNLEDVLKPVMELADKLDAGEFEINV